MIKTQYTIKQKKKKKNDTITVEVHASRYMQTSRQLQFGHGKSATPHKGIDIVRTPLTFEQTYNTSDKNRNRLQFLNNRMNA